MFEYWRTKSGHTKAKLTDKRRTVIAARLRTNSADDLKLAVDGACADEWLRGANDRGRDYCYPETIFKNDDAVERHIDHAREPGRRKAGRPEGRNDFRDPAAGGPKFRQDGPWGSGGGYDHLA